MKTARNQNFHLKLPKQCTIIIGKLFVPTYDTYWLSNVLKESTEDK